MKNVLSASQEWRLTEEDIKACIAYAGELVEEEELFPPDEKTKSNLTATGL